MGKEFMQLGKYEIVVLVIWYVHLEIFAIWLLSTLNGGCFCKKKMSTMSKMLLEAKQLNIPLQNLMPR